MKNTNKRSTKTLARFFFVTAFGLFALGLGFTLRYFFGEHSVSAAQLPPPAETIVILSSSTNPTIETPTEETFPDRTNSSLTQEINGMLVSASQFRRENDRVLVDVCYSLPTSQDWTMWDARLVDESHASYPWEKGEPIIIREPPMEGKQKVTTFTKTQDGVKMSKPFWEDAGGVMGQRCDTLYFANIPQSANRFTFTLDAIAAYPREGEECDPSYLAKFQAALDARQSGIRVDCQHEELSGGLKVVDHPATMSLEEAENVLHGNDLFLEVNGIRGPWVFSFEIR